MANIAAAAALPMTAAAGGGVVATAVVGLAIAATVVLVGLVAFTGLGMLWNWATRRDKQPKHKQDASAAV